MPEDNNLPESHLGNFRTMQGKTLFVYARTNQQKILIVSPDCIGMLKKGCVLMTPDEEFVLAFSYDIEETNAQATAMMECTGNTIDGEIMKFIIKDGARPKRKKKKTDAKETGTERTD
jgi:hypothetical protein